MFNYQTAEKLPPQNIEAEMSVLGSMLIEEEAVLKCIDLLDAEAFYRTQHKLVFKAISAIFQKSEAVDIVTVSDELQKRNELSSIGGAEYLSELVNGVITASNVGYYAKIVRDKALLRDLIKVSSRIIEEGYRAEDEPYALLDRAEQQVFEIRHKSVRGGFVELSGMVEDSIEMIEKICNREADVSGLMTGFRNLDSLMSGLHKGNLIIVAGRPSMGKTALCLNIAQQVGLEKKIPVGIFSLEMAAEELMQRILCSEAQVDSRRVRDGVVGSKEWASLTTAAGRLKTAKIMIDDTPALTPLEMKARARRIKAQYPDLGLIIVDYIQLMSASEGPSDNRQQEIAFISRSLKIMAKEIGVPVIALSQLSRAPEKRGGDARPRLSDLRESGAIEQDADAVIFLYRPSFYKNPEEIGPDEQDIAKVIVGKQRNGPTGQVEMLFQKQYTRFRTLTHRREN
ncbi:MAG: replicative DNA helicase [Elusimicrobiota bacterium]